MERATPVALMGCVIDKKSATGVALVLSVLFAAKAVLGVIIAAVEVWPLGQGVYFAFIIGLTIGYGDFVRRHPLTQILAVVIGFLGIILIGLVSALAVKAFQASSGPHQRPVH